MTAGYLLFQYSRPTPVLTDNPGLHRLTGAQTGIILLLLVVGVNHHMGP
jgi:hypothetical protein